MPQDPDEALEEIMREAMEEMMEVSDSENTEEILGSCDPQDPKRRRVQRVAWLRMEKGAMIDALLTTRMRKDNDPFCFVIKFIEDGWKDSMTVSLLKTNRKRSG